MSNCSGADLSRAAGHPRLRRPLRPVESTSNRPAPRPRRIDIRQAAQRVFDSWIDAATHQLRAAGLAIDDAQDLAVLFVAIVEGGFILSRTQRSVEPMRAAARRLVPLIEAAVGEGLRSRG